MKQPTWETSSGALVNLVRTQKRCAMAHLFTLKLRDGSIIRWTDWTADLTVNNKWFQSPRSTGYRLGTNATDVWLDADGGGWSVTTALTSAGVMNALSGATDSAGRSIYVGHTSRFNRIKLYFDLSGYTQNTSPITVPQQVGVSTGTGAITLSATVSILDPATHHLLDVATVSFDGSSSSWHSKSSPDALYWPYNTPSGRYWVALPGVTLPAGYKLVGLFVE